MRTRFLLVLACLCAQFSQPLLAQDQDSRYWEGLVYFQLKPELNLKLESYERTNMNTRKTQAAYKGFPEILSVLKNHEVKKLDVAFKGLEMPSIENIYSLEFDDEAGVSDILQTLQNSSKIAYAERVPKNYHSTLALPNDPGLNQLWFLETIEAPAGWELANPQREVVVAVVDDAVAIQHEDLAANIWRNTQEINGSPGVDDDGNGFVDDFFGWDGAMNDNNPNPPSNATDQYFMHGTHVAGTVGAVTNNGRGSAALSYNSAKIMACKGGRDSDGALTGVWQAFAYAVTNNVDVINNSWGRGIDENGNPPAPLAQFERDLLDAAAQRGIVVLFAAGNENASVAWPAAYDGVIAVAATGNLNTGERDQKASYSNFAPWVDIAAPGSQIYSLSPGPSRYVTISGTSMATPNTASLVALMMAHAPNFTANQIVNCLLSSTDNIDARNPNFVGLLGGGRINVRKAIACVSNASAPSCGIPANLSVSNVENTQATLNWGTVSGATGYNAEIRVLGNPNWFSFQENPFPSNQVNVSGMTEGTQYEFRVQAVCGQSLSTFSAPFTFQTTGGSGTPGNACVSYNDLYADFANGGDCSNTPITGGLPVWTNEAYRINACVPGQTYTFSICNGYNPNAWEARLTAALLNDNNVPTDVLATIEGCELSFTIPESFPSAVNVVVVVADANDCGGATRQINNGIPVLTCEGTLTPCVAFNFTNTALLAGGDCNNNPIASSLEVWDNEAYLVDACVPGQTYTFSICNGYNPENWEAKLTAATRDANNNPVEVLAIVEGCELSFSIPESFQAPVDVMVVAANTDDCGGPTLEIDNGIPSISCPGASCAPPTALRTEDISNNEALLAWDAVSNSDSYTIQARETGAQEWAEAIGFTGTQIPFTNLLPCTEYEFRISANCGTEVSEFSEPFRFTTTGCQPACPSPTNVAAAPNGQQATISWTGNQEITQYIVNYRTRSAVTWLSRSTTSTSFTLDSLTNCLTYEYQVIGLCDAGTQAVSAIDTFDIECQTCSAPDEINFVAVTPFNANIVWNAQPIDLGYVVEAKAANSSDWLSAEIQENEAFYSGLNPCSTYEVRIKAVCSSGESDFSQIKQLTTIGCDGPAFCNAQGENSRFEWIESIEMETLNNPSGDNFGYKFFTDIAAPSFELGNTISLTLTPGFLDETFEEYWGIWIDLNQDGTFDNETENVFNSQTPTSVPIVSSFVLPAEAQIGETTMRIAMKYFEASTDADRPQACTTFDFGEVEDYRINIVGTVSNAPDLNAGSLIKVFPNPFKDQVNVEGLMSAHTLRVVDILGRVVHVGAEMKPGKVSTLDLSHLDSGIYFLEILSDNSSIQRKKIVKQ